MVLLVGPDCNSVSPIDVDIFCYHFFVLARSFLLTVAGVLAIVLVIIGITLTSPVKSHQVISYIMQGRTDRIVHVMPMMLVVVLSPKLLRR